MLGQHFVLRGMASIAELDDFKRLLPKLDQEEREKLYSRRKTHKELSIFLHEWAHTLGALHVQDVTRIMGPGYSNRTSTFSVEDALLIAAGLEARLEARGKETIDWTPLRKMLAEAQGDWVKSDRQALLGQLQAARRRPPPAACRRSPSPAWASRAARARRGRFSPGPASGLQTRSASPGPGAPREEPAGEPGPGEGRGRSGAGRGPPAFRAPPARARPTSADRWVRPAS